MSDLFDAIDALTLPRVTGVMQGDRLVKITHDPLLAQLEQAITSSFGGSSAGGGSATGSILNDAALSRFTQIESQIRGWCRLAGVTVTRSATANLRAWGVQVLAADTSGHVVMMRDWARDIHNLIDPPKPVPLRGACVACQATHEVAEDGGKREALVAEYVPVGDLAEMERSLIARCRVCDERWNGAEAVAELMEELDEKAGGAVFVNPD